jgi:hypothetical protein
LQVDEPQKRPGCNFGRRIDENLGVRIKASAKPNMIQKIRYKKTVVEADYHISESRWLPRQTNKFLKGLGKNNSIELLEYLYAVKQFILFV